MFGTDELIQVLSGFCGTFGFGILFNIRGYKLLWASLGGLLSWLLFACLSFYTESEVARYFIVSVIVSVYAEIMARKLKTPTTTFCTVSLVPLVPGGSLYYTMAYGLNGDGANFITNGVHTLKLAAALSLGIVLVMACTKHTTVLKERRTAARRQQ